jgi:hypothetical protein
MTRPRSYVFVLAAALLAGWPASAYAASDIIGWFGELSGPGPFKVKGTGFESRAWCFSTAEAARDSVGQKVLNCLLDDPEKTRAVVSFQVNWASSGPIQLFKDDPTDFREVHERTINVMFMYRANSVLEVGGGLSWMQFSSDEGKAFSFSRAGFTPARVTFTPLGAIHGSPRARALARVVHLQFESVYISGGFSGADFNNTKTAYKVDAEFQGHASILIDGAAIIRALRTKS